MRPFFWGMAYENSGLIGERLSTNTLCSYATCLATAYKQEYNVKIPEEVVGQVKNVSGYRYSCSVRTANTTIVDSK
jgi:hypothetical protein